MLGPSWGHCLYLHSRCTPTECRGGWMRGHTCSAVSFRFYFPFSGIRIRLGFLEFDPFSLISPAIIWLLVTFFFLNSFCIVWLYSQHPQYQYWDICPIGVLCVLKRLLNLFLIQYIISDKLADVFDCTLVVPSFSVFSQYLNLFPFSYFFIYSFVPTLRILAHIHIKLFVCFIFIFIDQLFVTVFICSSSAPSLIFVFK